jgi:hypothetical protein
MDNTIFFGVKNQATLTSLVVLIFFDYFTKQYRVSYFFRGNNSVRS